MSRAAAQTQRRRSDRPPRRAARSTVAALLAAALLALSACTPLYVPLIPSDMLVPEPAFRLHGDAHLALAGTPDEPTLTLRVRAAEVPGPGWLAVQWFGPSGPALASDSLWFDADDVGLARSLAAPEHLSFRPGEWRAVLSWQRRLVRQLLVTVP